MAGVVIEKPIVENELCLIPCWWPRAEEPSFSGHRDSHCTRRAFHHFPLFRAVDSVDVDGSSSDDL